MSSQILRGAEEVTPRRCETLHTIEDFTKQHCQLRRFDAIMLKDLNQLERIKIVYEIAVGNCEESIADVVEHNHRAVCMSFNIIYSSSKYTMFTLENMPECSCTHVLSPQYEY